MQTGQLRVVVAVDDLALRARLIRSLSQNSFVMHVLSSSFDLRQFPILDTDFIVLETNDDVAAMVQIVYELYKATGVNDYTLPIMAVASVAAVRSNPALALWLTDNHAAIMCLVSKEDIDFEELPRRLKMLVSD